MANKNWEQFESHTFRKRDRPLMRHLARDQWFQRQENRALQELNSNAMRQYEKEDRKARISYESDARAAALRHAYQQRQADREFAMAEAIEQKHRRIEADRRQQYEEDAIAMALHNQQQKEIRNAKIRQGLRENTPELRSLRESLNMALINQARDMQIQERKRREAQTEAERKAEEAQLLRHALEEERARDQEEQAKAQALRESRIFIEQQRQDRQRRMKLLEQAERMRDREEMDAAVQRERDQYFREVAERRERGERYKAEIDEFLRQRALLKEAERRREEEEKRKIDQFIQDVDERLARAQEEQKRRDAQQARVAAGIGQEIRRQNREREEYEQMCIDLAYYAELDRLKQREIAEQQKIQRQYEEARRYMAQCELEKQKRIQQTRAEEERTRQQLQEQQRRLDQLAELEAEQNRMRLEKYRRELARQVIARKEMYERAKQEELARIARENEREARRQALIEEERRNLVVQHILAMGPESVKYLPKGVLKEGDLDYLPQDYRDAILEGGHLRKFYSDDK